MNSSDKSDADGSKEGSKKVDDGDCEEKIIDNQICISDDDISFSSNESNSKRKKVMASDDEYISDSSSEEDIKEKNQIKQETKKTESEMIATLPTSIEKDKSFELNGMKVIIRKRPQRKRSHKTICFVCLTKNEIRHWW